MTPPAAAPRLIRYVVRLDRGGSPNPYHGWCSLAVCKPVIRRTARVGDWIVGLRSRRHDQVVYAMRVDAVLPLGDYWRDPRFRAKRPGARAGTPPDNFYRPAAGGRLVHVDNPLQGPDEADRNRSGRNALVSWRYWYFGDRSPELPTDLVHLVHAGQGHAVAGVRPGDMAALQAWLSSWSPGLHGEPIDLPEPTRTGAVVGRPTARGAG